MENQHLELAKSSINVDFPQQTVDGKSEPDPERGSHSPTKPLRCCSAASGLFHTVPAFEIGRNRKKRFSVRFASESLLQAISTQGLFGSCLIRSFAQLGRIYTSRAGKMMETSPRKSALLAPADPRDCPKIGEIESQLSGDLLGKWWSTMRSWGVLLHIFQTKPILLGPQNLGPNKIGWVREMVLGWSLSKVCLKEVIPWVSNHGIQQEWIVYDFLFNTTSQSVVFVGQNFDSVPC